MALETYHQIIFWKLPERYVIAPISLQPASSVLDFIYLLLLLLTPWVENNASWLAVGFLKILNEGGNISLET